MCFHSVWRFIGSFDQQKHGVRKGKYNIIDFIISDENAIFEHVSSSKGPNDTFWSFNHGRCFYNLKLKCYSQILCWRSAANFKFWLFFVLIWYGGKMVKTRNSEAELQQLKFVILVELPIVWLIKFSAGFIGWQLLPMQRMDNPKIDRNISVVCMF